MPAFAAPLAASTLNGDVNITPNACDVKLRGAFVSCPATKHGPVVVGFVTVDDKECRKLQPSLGTLARAYPGMTVVLVGLRGDRKPLVKLAAAQPQVTTVWDRSATLANRYGIAVCPTVVVAQQGGLVKGTLIGSDVNNAAWLGGQVTALLAPGK
jgi:thiol-disulfide isomerase/thioredoxin